MKGKLTMGYTISIFAMAVTNLPFALLEGNQFATFNWIGFGICFGLGIASIMNKK